MFYVLIPTTKERRPRLEKCINAIRESTCQYPFSIITYENDTDGGWAQALLKMIEGINGVVFLLSDDMIVERDCIQTLYKKYIERFPKFDGMAQPYENFGHGQHGDCPMIHTDTLRPFLEIGYQHYADAEISDRLHKQGKYLVVSEAKVFHEHPSQYPELMDETYRKAHSKQQEDMNLFITRMKTI